MNYFKKFNKLEIKYKDKVIPVFPLFLAVLSLFMITIGGSYAYLTQVVKTDSVNIITAGNLNLSFVSGNNNIGIINALPQEDASALANNNVYTFNIKNTGSISSYYELFLNNICVKDEKVSVGDKEITSDICIPIEYVRVAIKKGDEEYIIRNIGEDNKVLLDSEILNAGATSGLYSLKIWLDINTPNAYNVKDKNVVFAANLSLYGEQKYIKKVGAECFEVENNKIVDYTCNYTDIEISDDISGLSAVATTNSYKNVNPSFMINDIHEHSINQVADVVVDTIAANAFDGKGLRSVIIKDNIKTIEDNAFLNNPNLKDVTINDNVKLSTDSFNTSGEIVTIQNEKGEFPSACFRGYKNSAGTLSTLNSYLCKSAVYVTIPEYWGGVKIFRFDPSLFKDYGIKSVDFSKASELQSIGANAFANNSIKVVDLSYNKKLNKIDNYAFLNNEIVLLKLPNYINFTLGNYTFDNNKLESVYLPDYLTAMGTYVFANNLINQVRFSNSLSLINDFAFDNNKLVELDIPRNITNIKSFAFRGNLLEKVTFPDTLTTIGNYAFYKNYIKNLALPDSVTSLGTHSFWSNQISSLKLSKSLTSIGSYAFRQNLIQEVIVPDGVTTIGEYAFQGNQVNKLVMPDTVTSIGASAFYNNKIVDLKLSEELTTIGVSAFGNNQISGEVVIPSKVTSIGTLAFYKVKTSNSGLIKIINKTGRAFDWKALFVANQTGDPFVSGVVTTSAGDVEIVAG